MEKKDFSLLALVSGALNIGSFLIVAVILFAHQGLREAPHGEFMVALFNFTITPVLGILLGTMAEREKKQKPGLYRGYKFATVSIVFPLAIWGVGFWYLVLSFLTLRH